MPRIGAKGNRFGTVARLYAAEFPSSGLNWRISAYSWDGLSFLAAAIVARKVGRGSKPHWGVDNQDPRGVAGVTKGSLTNDMKYSESNQVKH